MAEAPAYRSREDQEDLRVRILDDPEAGWADFLDEYGPLLRNIIRNFRLSPEDQEEAFQEVLHALIKDHCQAIRHWRFDKCPLPNYLAVITVRATINFTKSAFHQHSLRCHSPSDSQDEAISILDLLEQPTRTARDRLHRVHLAQTFEKILQRLMAKNTIRKEDYRLLILRMSGLSYKEIESILDISVETLTSRFARLKPLLKTALLDLGVTQADFLQD